MPNISAINAGYINGSAMVVRVGSALPSEYGLLVSSALKGNWSAPMGSSLALPYISTSKVYSGGGLGVYDLLLYTPVEGSLTSTYTGITGSSTTGVYGDAATVASSASAQYTLRSKVASSALTTYSDSTTVSASVGSSYTLRSKVSSTAKSTYSNAATVLSSTGGVYTLRSKVASSNTGVYGNSVTVAAYTQSLYSLRSTTQGSVSFQYSNASVVGSDVAIGYDVLSLTLGSHISMPYTLRSVAASSLQSLCDFTFPVEAGVDIPYSLGTGNKVSTSISGRWSLRDEATTTITNIPPYVMIGNAKIPLLSAEVVAEEGNPAWNCTLGLVSEGALALFVLGEPFSLHLMGEVYAMITPSKSRGQSSPSERTFTVTGISPTILYTGDYAEAVTKVWSTPTLASSVADELLGVGTVTWGIVDWIIPPNRLSASSAAPLSIVKNIVTAAGGVLECAPDGKLYARKKFPIPVQQYAEHVPDRVYSDYTDVLSSSESANITKKFDKIRIADSDASYGDSAEYKADQLDPSVGDLKVFLSPLRSNYSVRHTSGANTTMVNKGRVSETLTETVEFVRGSASLSKPIYTLSKVLWLNVPLGGVTFVAGSNTLTSSTPSESLAEVTYATKYQKYRVSGVVGSKAQFVVEAT